MGIMINSGYMALERSALASKRDPIFKDVRMNAGGLEPSNIKSDTLQLSYQAKEKMFRGFRVHFKDSSKDAVSWAKQLRASGTNPALKLLDEHIAQAGNLLEQMKELAKLAQNEKLSDAGRLALQIDIGRLQFELDCETERMMNKYSSGEARVVFHEQQYEDTDAYKMLDRAAKRLAKGEKWNVAEVLTPIVSGPVYDPRDGSKKSLDNMLVEKYEWEVSDDVNAPTVDDILKAKGRSVMDSKAAGVTVAELELDLSKLQEQRDKLTSFVKNNGINPQGADTAESDTSKKIASLFMGTFNFLCTLSRDPVEYNYGPAKSPYEIFEDFIPVDFDYDLSNKSVDTLMIATVAHSKANSGCSLTKTVLRPDPDEVIIPFNSTRRVVAVEITKDDPEFYKRAPRVHNFESIIVIYNNLGNL